MPRSQHKTSTSNPANSHSYIFSDISRAIHREQSLTRKLKHLQQQNIELQNKIREQQQQIKDERTVIIYQMNQLNKAVLAKVMVSGELKINRAQLNNDGLKTLMNKFQDIQKQKKMVTKVRVGLDKMNQSYNQHKQSIEQLMHQGNTQHQQIEHKMHTMIAQKKNQFQILEEATQSLCQDINRMQYQLNVFEEEQPNLDKEEEMLRKMIVDKEKQIVDLGKKLIQVSKWEQIVVDRKARNNLMSQISNKRTELATVSQRLSDAGVQVKEIKMKIGAI